MPRNRPQPSSNRQRNISVTSNTSSSSCKDNSFVLQHQRAIESADPRRIARSSIENGSSIGDRQFRSSFPDFPRPTSFYDVPPIADHSRAEYDNQEIQDKLKELQHSKWQYEHIMSQLHQLQSSSNREPHPISRSDRPIETGNNDAVYLNINTRTQKLQEAQQKLIQLQELMQNVSIDLDFHPLSEENKINKPNLSAKEFPAEFLRNVPGNVSSRSTTIPRINPNVRRNRVLPQQPLHCSLQQNNLSQDQPSSPKRYSTPHANSSLLDVFERSGPSLDSSDEESTVEIEEEPTEVTTETNAHNDHMASPLLNSETTARNLTHIPMVCQFQNSIFMSTFILIPLENL